MILSLSAFALMLYVQKMIQKPKLTVWGNSSVFVKNAHFLWGDVGECGEKCLTLAPNYILRCNHAVRRKHRGQNR